MPGRVCRVGRGIAAGRLSGADGRRATGQQEGRGRCRGRCTSVENTVCRDVRIHSAEGRGADASRTAANKAGRDLYRRPRLALSCLLS